MMKRNHILEERRETVDPVVRKTVNAVFDRIDEESIDKDKPHSKV